MYKIPAITLFIGKNLVFMPECHSTNTFALDLCQQPSTPADGTVIITANQSAGRGQRGSDWQAEPGKNLTFSIILKPHFLNITDQFYLNIFSSLSIRDYLINHECAGVSIKWPNDIYLCDKKVCGILIENQLSGGQLISTVLGVGLNINQQSFELPSATSLAIHKHQTFDLSQELETLLYLTESRYLQLRQRRLSSLMSDYLDSLYWLNEEHTFENSTLGQFTGTIVGIAKSGQLRMLVDGREVLFGVKEFAYVE